MKVLVMNGPPRAGKDTLLNLVEQYIKDEHPNLEFSSFSYKWVLCYAVGARYHVDPQWVWDLNADTHKKDLPHPRFGGKSVRQCLIYESEENIKKEFGPHGVAVKTFNGIVEDLGTDKLSSPLMIIGTADGGFNEELDAMYEAFGITRKDVFIVRIDREGHTFAGDSREYLRNPDMMIMNDGVPFDMLRKVKDKLDEFLKV